MRDWGISNRHRGDLSAFKSLQHPEGIDHINLPEKAGSKRQPVDSQRRLTAFLRIGKDIVHQQEAACNDVPRPGVVIIEHRFA